VSDLIGLGSSKELVKLREENFDLKNKLMSLENKLSMSMGDGGNDYEQKMQRVVRDYLEQIE